MDNWEKSDSYWERERTQNGRKINDALDKHQESTEWAKVANQPEYKHREFYEERSQAIQEKTAWRNHFDKTGEMVTPKQAVAEYERMDDHVEKLIQAQMNTPMSAEKWERMEHLTDFDPITREDRFSEITRKYSEATRGAERDLEAPTTKPTDLESYRQEKAWNQKHHTTQEQRDAARQMISPASENSSTRQQHLFQQEQSRSDGLSL